RQKPVVESVPEAATVSEQPFEAVAAPPPPQSENVVSSIVDWFIGGKGKRSKFVETFFKIVRDNFISAVTEYANDYEQDHGYNPFTGQKKDKVVAKTPEKEEKPKPEAIAETKPEPEAKPEPEPQTQTRIRKTKYDYPENATPEEKRKFRLKALKALRAEAKPVEEAVKSVEEVKAVEEVAPIEEATPKRGRGKGQTTVGRKPKAEKNIEVAPAVIEDVPVIAEESTEASDISEVPAVRKKRSLGRPKSPDRPKKYDRIEDFADWTFNNQALTSSNYITNYFKKDKKKFINALVKYASAFESNFFYNPFSFEMEDYDTFMEKFKVNLYEKYTDFFKYSNSVSNHMPRAILGKKSYFVYLEELRAKKSADIAAKGAADIAAKEAEELSKREE
ncbi:MAG: hypothetical protein LBT42_03400, partial [Tannerella sp.]|nr:hypothetical protein [Tannerella sp.]